MPCSPPPQTRARPEVSESECRDRKFSKKKICRDGPTIARQTKPPNSPPEVVIHVFMCIVCSPRDHFFSCCRHVVGPKCPGTTMWRQKCCIALDPGTVQDYGLRRCYHRVLAPLYTHAMLWAALRRHRVHAEPGTGPLPQRQPSFSYPFLLTVLDPLPSRVKPIRHYTLRSDRNNTPRCLS